MFEVKIASLPDRDKLVAEISFNNVQIAELNQEKTELEIEFYNLTSQTFNFNSFISALNLAHEKLKSPTKLR